MKARVYHPVYYWLPWLTLIWVFATWYGETRLERFELVGSGTNELAEGDFSEGLPRSTDWEWGPGGDTIWQSAGGVDGGAALRLVEQGGHFLRYRVTEADRHAGYFLGLCLRWTDAPADAEPVEAKVRLLRTQPPRLTLPARTLVAAGADGAWACGLDGVGIPLGFQELVLDVAAPEAGGALWVDRVALYPAFSSPDYELAHVALVAGWITLGAGAFVLLWYLLGVAGGLLVVLPGTALAFYVLFAGGVLGLPPALDAAVLAAQPVVGEAADYVLDIGRVMLGEDAGGRWTGAIDTFVVAALVVLGFVAAIIVGVRFRWLMRRPWGRVIAAGLLFGLALQALRLLVHVPGHAALQWVFDPLAMSLGILLGAVLAEPSVRLYTRFAQPPVPEQPATEIW